MINFFKIIFKIYIITAIITHIWTIIIAFIYGGFWGGIITLFLPFLSELFWMIKMFGQNNLYAVIALIHLVLAIPISLISKRN